ncbi:MAG TPA: PAS domain S-box protein, partial [Limnochordales bacterium]
MAEALLHAVELSEDIIFITDTQGNFVHVNAAFERITGWRRDEVVGKPVRLLKSGEHPASFYRALWTTLRRGQPFRATFINRKRSGELFFEDQTITPVLDAAGQPAYFVAVGKDVTAREETVRALQRLTAILENTSDCVAIVRPDGQLEWCNGAARRMLGVDEARDIRTLRLRDVVARSSLRTVLELAVPTALQLGWWRGEVHLRHQQDGREVPVSQVIIAHKAPDGRVEYLSTIARDISEERRLRSAIQRAYLLERALRTIDAALLQEKPLQEVLEALCDGVVTLGFRMCWVGLKEPDFTIRPLASRGLATDYLQAIRVRWDEDSPLGRGPGGIAARTGQTVVIHDTATDPRFAPWREEALRRGYRSNASVPLRTNHEVLGILAVYAERAGAFDEESVRALETLAQQGTLAVVTARQREELRRIQQLQDFHVEHMPLAHILWDT